ncbi:transposase [Desulfogranum marinum]|uniref:transposase n=1 Tax=Desulfogranum marinum TaxID=453220 RepID=UPI0029C63552|nr:transposase [Desulfogranum marinum]
MDEPIIAYKDEGPDEYGTFKWINVMFGNIKMFLHGNYHHVNSRYLPWYLAEFYQQFPLWPQSLK